MKKIIFIVLATVMLQSSGFCQTETTFPTYKNKIQTNLLPMIWGNFILTSDYNLTYERFIKPDYSVELGASLIDINLLLLNARPMFRDSVEINGYGFSIHPKYHKIKNGFSKWEFGPELYFQRAKYIDKLEHYDNMTLYKWRLTLKTAYNINLGKFTISPFIGIGAKYRNFQWKSDGPADQQTSPNLWNYEETWTIKMEKNVKFSLPFGVRLGMKF